MNKTILTVLAICFTLPACGGGTDLSSLMARVDASERRATDAEARATRAEELRDQALAGTSAAPSTSGGDAPVTTASATATTAPTSSAPGFTPVMSCDGIDSTSMFNSGMVTFTQAYLQGMEPWSRASGGVNEVLVMNISGYDVQLVIDGHVVHTTEGPGVYPTGNLRVGSGNECAMPVIRPGSRYVINTADLPGRADTSRVHSYTYRCMDTAGGTIASDPTPRHDGTLNFSNTYSAYGPTITIAPGSC